MTTRRIAIALVAATLCASCGYPSRLVSGSHGTDATEPPAATPTAAAPTASHPASPAVTPATSGVYGVVTAGPSCPVERKDQPCPPHPVRGRVDAKDAQGRVVGSVKTDANGRYDLDLPPGRYTLVVDTGGSLPRCPETDVTVMAGAAAKADISCDSGIR